MEKIKLKISLDQLKLINTFLTEILSHKPTNPVFKAMHSILRQTSIKLQKKQIDKVSTKDKFNVNFYYHEAYQLSHVLQMHLNFAEGEYEKNMILKMFNELNQSLT